MATTKCTASAAILLYKGTPVRMYYTWYCVRICGVLFKLVVLQVYYSDINNIAHMTLSRVVYSSPTVTLHFAMTYYNAIVVTCKHHPM